MKTRKSYKIKCNLSVGYANADREDILDLEECTGYAIEALNAMSQEELDEVVYAACKEWAWEYIELGGEIV